MQDKEIVTAGMVIESWSENVSTMKKDEDFYRSAYEERAPLYDDAPSFEQYQALSAYVLSMFPGNLEYASGEEKADAYQGTFGTLFPGASTEDLQRVLDDHYQAMSKAYELEKDACLGDISL